METDLNIIATKSIIFLDNMDDWGWAAFPVSRLPYPKETIKKSLIEYVKEHGKHMDSVKIEVMVYEYAFLACFLNDKDAALINSMALREGQNDMQHKELIETIELPQTLQDTDIFRRYLEIREKMAAENAAMRTELHAIAEQSSAT